MFFKEYTQIYSSNESYTLEYFFFSIRFVLVDQFAKLSSKWTAQVISILHILYNYWYIVWQQTLFIIFHFNFHTSSSTPLDLLSGTTFYT